MLGFDGGSTSPWLGGWVWCRIYLGCFGFNVAMLGVYGSLVVVNWWLERKCETQEGWGEKKKDVWEEIK